MSSEEDDVLRFGWGKYRPRCLQVVNNGKGLTFFLSIFLCLHIMTANGLLSAVMPDIEKRFQLTGTDLGLLAMCNEFAQLFLIGLVSYYGSYGNQPKWLGCGCLVTGLGSLLFVLPHLLVEKYTIEGTENSLVQSYGLCTLTNTTGDQQCSTSTVQQRKVHYMAIFGLAQFLIGAGSCPLYSLGQAFIDESVPPKSLPVYIGVWLGSGIVGNSVGLIVGGVFSSTFVNGKPPIGIKPGDQRWIGAWWIGYLLTGSILIVCSAFISGYPRHIPGSREKRQEAMSNGELPQEDQLFTGELRQICPAFLQLLRNSCFVLITFKRALISIPVGGYSGFLTKLFLTRFPMEPAKAGLFLFCTTLICSNGGIMFGSLICRQLNIKKYCKQSALVLFVLTLFTTLSYSDFFIPGCSNREITGVTQSYNLSASSKIQLDNYCNQNCSCPTDQINLVCSNDGKMFLSPCHAGCHTTSVANQTFGNCSCVYSNTSRGGSVSKNYCHSSGSNCVYLWLHLTVFVLALFVYFACETPYRTLTLRCVPYSQRGFASGVQAAVNRILGFQMGAIVFGSIFDFSCLLWSEKCGQRGNCLWYNIQKLFYWLGSTSMAIGVVASILGFLAFLSVKPEVKLNAMNIMDDKNKESDGNETFQLKSCSAVES